MCGIVGIWNINGKKLDTHELDRFTDSLSHRGPDGRGIFIDNTENLSLGHRRLAILDLSPKGHQPMSYENERYWITLNGEIYNFIELRNELETIGCSFKSDSDTEVILAAYSVWKEQCQLKFNGMWAFAIWDKREKTLFLSRDRFGVKPLFYFWDGHCLAFASEKKAFLQLDSFHLEFDYALLKWEIEYPTKMEGLPNSIFKGVQRLLGGYSLTLTRGQEPVVKRWWNTLEHLEENTSLLFSKRARHFKELFFDAVKMRMRSDVPIGTALSGGLDSSSVLCAMAGLAGNGIDHVRRAPENHKSFVASYGGTTQDETPFATEVIQKVKGTGIFVEIKPLAVIDEIDKIVFQMEEVNNEIASPPWFLYQKMRQEGVVVSLDGHGGDELLGGYPHHPPWAMRDTVWPLPRPLRLLMLQKTLRGLYTDGKINNFPVQMPSIPFLLKRKRFQAKPENFADLIADQPLMKSFDSLNRGLYTDFHFTVLPTILRNFDRLSMGHGVEIRAPFMDWRLVCYAFSLPASNKIGAGYTKRILREAMKGVLPETIRTRTTKIGFGNPRSEWVMNPWKQFIMDNLSSKDFLESHLWNGPQILEKITNHYRNHEYNQIIYIEKYIQANLLLRLFKKVVNHS